MYILGDAIVYEVCYMLAFMPSVVLTSKLCPKVTTTVPCRLPPAATPAPYMLLSTDALRGAGARVHTVCASSRFSEFRPAGRASSWSRPLRAPTRFCGLSLKHGRCTVAEYLRWNPGAGVSLIGVFGLRTELPCVLDGANPAAESRTFSIYQRRSMIHDLVVQVFRGSLPRATYSPRSC